MAQIVFIQKISQATLRDEIWFMTRVDVVAAYDITLGSISTRQGIIVTVPYNYIIL